VSSPNRRSPRATALSQHRLRDSSVAERIVASTGLAPPDVVFELGAGDGTLTDALARRCRRVVAIEIDRASWARLKGRFRGNPVVTPVLGDMLLHEFPRQGAYKLIANVPYSATSRLFRMLLTLANPPAEAYLILASDAAQRWLGLGHDSLASIQLKARFEVSVALALRRGDFTPRPDVDAVVARLMPRPGRRRLSDATAFDGFVRAGFGSGRRTICDNLGRLMSREQFLNVAAPRGFDRETRPHELTIEDWAALYLETQRPRGTPRAHRARPRQG
jgi:23S rRNA (adenine-N6)-dimethyltransferase